MIEEASTRSHRRYCIKGGVSRLGKKPTSYHIDRRRMGLETDVMHAYIPWGGRHLPLIYSMVQFGSPGCGPIAETVVVLAARNLVVCVILGVF